MMTDRLDFRFIPLALLLVIVTVGTGWAEVTIDTSTSQYATANSARRKTFYDSVGQNHWAFYHNGSAIEYSYSSNGTTWNSAGTLAYNTEHFSLTYRVISREGNVFLVTEANTYDVVIRRGVISGNSIAFADEVTVFNGSSTTIRLSLIHI